MSVKAMELFDAYSRSLFPKEAGYIISSYFSNNSAYSRYEIVSYNNVKSIYASSESLTFHTDGKRLFILVEPMNYPNKSIEPYCRSNAEQIPFRFKELDEFTAKNQTKIYIANQANIAYGSFTVMRPAGMDFSILFYPLPDMHETMQAFFEKTLSKEAGVPMTDAKKAAKKIAENIKSLIVQDYTTG
jgi:hypothetical protein